MWTQAFCPKALALTAVWAVAGLCQAQTPPLHFPHPVGMPPGVVGAQRLGRGGPVVGVFQPVEIMAPEGVLIALAEAGTWAQPQKAPVHVGLLVGQVYRICVWNIPGQIGQEVFPTIEVIDRLYAPAGQETRFPIQIELTAEDLRLALEGKYVTRVIYLENPERALPALGNLAGQPWFEVPPGRDPLVVADALGRPVAIVRLGGRVPEQAERLDPQFLFGCPPVWRYDPPPSPAAQAQSRVSVLPRPPRPGRAQPVAMEVSPR